MPRRALEVFGKPGAVALAALVSVAPLTSAQAHRGIEIAPALGAYIPAGTVEVLWGCFADGTPCVPPALRQDRAIALGGRVTSWLGRRGAIEGSLTYSPSSVTDTAHYATAEPSGFGGGGSVLLASIRAVFRVVVLSPATSLLLITGPAVVHRAGAAWPSWTYGSRRTGLGGVLGIGLDLRPGHGTAFRAAVEGLLYNLDSKGPYWETATFHHDLAVSLSISRDLFSQGREHR